VVDAQVLIRDRAVYLRKYCPEHGWHEALVSSDADWYLNSLKFNKPGSIPYDFTMRLKKVVLTTAVSALNTNSTPVSELLRLPVDAI